jgi:hypothetical protein
MINRSLRILVAVFCLLAANDALAARGEIEITVAEAGTGKPLVVRMHLRNHLNRPQRGPRVPFWHDHFVFAGRIILALPPGHYAFEVERGPEYRSVSGHFELESGDADSKHLQMERFVDMKEDGWYSGDLHVRRPPLDVEMVMLADDLHVAQVIGATNAKNSWAEKTLPSPLVKQFDDNRYHQLVGSEDRRPGGVLVFGNLPIPLSLPAVGSEFPSSVDLLKQARVSPGKHVAIARPNSWDMPLWVASGMVDSICLAHGDLTRGEMAKTPPPGRLTDEDIYPTPSDRGRYAQDLYYRLLNCGLRIPPSAGSGTGVAPNPIGYNRVYVYCEGELTWEKWFAGLKAGRVVVTNGPMLRPDVQGHEPGHVFRAADGETVELQVALNLSTRDKIEYLEIIKNGKVVREVALRDWAAAGGELPPLRFQQSGWFLVRAVVDNPVTYRFATTGPYYVEIGEKRRISRRDAHFFLDWVYERAGQIKLADAAQQSEVMAYHRGARDFWKNLVDTANAD